MVDNPAPKTQKFPSHEPYWQLDKALTGYETFVDGSLEVHLRFVSIEELAFFTQALSYKTVVVGPTANHQDIAQAVAIERERCARIAEGSAQKFDFLKALAEHDDMEYGRNGARIDIARAIREGSPAPKNHVQVLETALSKINAIRNSIIGCQTVNWSEHIYPLVAALEEAGIAGDGYPTSRANVGTMLERTIAAENEVIGLRAALAAIEYRDLSIEEAKTIASAALATAPEASDAN